MAEATSKAASKPGKRKGCPICGAPAEERFRPFCSKRCADVDLGRWFGERYVVPGDTPLDPDEEKPPSPESEDGPNEA